MVEKSTYFDLGNGSRAWQPCHLGKDLKIGEEVNIGALSHIGNQVKIGNDSRIQGSVYIADQTIIGKSCFLGPGTVITNDKYPPSNGKWSPVTIEDEVIIGASATLVAGVKLSHRCVIGAGAVITTDIPNEEVWAGNPAKFMMKRSEYEEKRNAHGP